MAALHVNERGLVMEYHVVQRSNIYGKLRYWLVTVRHNMTGRDAKHRGTYLPTRGSIREGKPNHNKVRSALTRTLTPRTCDGSQGCAPRDKG